MAAVAGIHNPIEKGETLLFFLSQDSQVGLSRRKEGAEDDTSPIVDEPTMGKPLLGTVPTRDDRPKGVIKNPSSFGAIMYKQLISVYGIRTDNRICLVSPAFVPLKGGPTTKFNCLAACGDGDDVGWLYYLADDPPTIKEYRLDPGASSAVESEPNSDTYLAAYYNPFNSTRHVIFQVKGSLKVVDVAAGAESKIPGTINAKPKTPLAACAVKANNSVKIYLYYCDADNKLLRIVRTGVNKWEPVTEPDNAPALADGTQLTVTTTVDKQYNQVFYVVRDGDGDFYKYMDKL